MDSLAQIGTLHTIAQIAISLIGFTGIVIVFGDRAKRSWSSEENLSLFALLIPSLIVPICILLPNFFLHGCHYSYGHKLNLYKGFSRL